MANIDGTSAGETLVGTSDADVIRGFEGNDILNGLAGADRLEGGTGDDTYYIDNPADVIVELIGEGFDSFYTGVSYTLGAGAEVEWLSTISTTATTALNISGNEFGQFLIGNAGANILNGAGGADTMIGYGGADIYFVDNANDVVLEAVGGGSDTIRTSVAYFLSAGVEAELLATFSSAGTGDINLTGNEFGQALQGNAGFNQLNGAGGADVMTGYGGSDSYLVDDAGDQVIEAAGEGFDAVYASVDYTLAAGVSVEWFTTINNFATSALNLTGNEIAQYLIGNAGANILNGGGGADLMYGLEGDDIYIVDNAGDVPVEGAGGGNDTVRTSVSYLLSTDIQVEKIETTNAAGTDAINLIGNNLAQELIGNAGANSLNGNGGADVLRGLGGNDNYFIDNAGDQIFEAAGAGFDAAYSEVSYTLAAGQEVEWLLAAPSSSTTAINLTGNELVNGLFGNAGANSLDGGGGSDTLTGYAGADTFLFTTALGANNVDTVADFVAGTDKIGLGGAIFTAAGPLGALNANAFVTGAAAADASDRIIYNNLTGQLFYDADGNGAGAAVQFATVTPGLALAASDFLVF